MGNKKAILGVFCGITLLIAAAVPSLNVVNTTGTITATFTGTGLESPTAGAVNPNDATEGFVCTYSDTSRDWYGGGVSRIDLETGGLTKINQTNWYPKSWNTIHPKGIALTDTKGYVISEYYSELYPFALTTGVAETPITFGSNTNYPRHGAVPTSLAIHNGKAYMPTPIIAPINRHWRYGIRLVVVDLATSEVTKYNLITRSGDIPTTNSPYRYYWPGGIAITDDGIVVINAMVATPKNSILEPLVLAFNANTNTLINFVALPDGTLTPNSEYVTRYVNGKIAVSGNKAYVTNFLADSVDVLDVSSEGVSYSSSIDGFTGPLGIYASDEGKIYVGNYGTYSAGATDASVTVIDSATDTIVDNYAGFSSPNTIFGQGVNDEIYVMEQTMLFYQKGTFSPFGGGISSLSTDSFRVNRGAITRQKGAF